MRRRPSKYGNQPTVFQGRRYASKAEAAYAAELDLRRRAGDVRAIVPQPRIELEPKIVYIPDFHFEQRTPEGWQAIYVDVKGVETPRFRLCKALWKLHGRVPLHIVARVRDRFVLREIVDAPP